MARKPVRKRLERDMETARLQTMASSTIRIQGPIPGPRSKELLARRQRSVARGLSTLHPLFVAEAHGAHVTDVDGNTYIDFTGGIGTMNVGHTRPELVRAAHAQAEKLTHSAIQVLGYEPYVAVAEALCKAAPISGEKRAMLVSTGTEAVENAVKMARAATKRAAVLCFEHAFHGRSLGGLSLTSRYKPYKAGFGPFLPEVYRVPYPYAYRQGLTAAESLAETKKRIAELFHTVIAPSEIGSLIVETVLGEGGFIVPPPGFLEHLREVTKQHGIVFIVDEVQAGFCRTGKLWAIEHFGVEPDLMTVAKSIAGGFPLGAVVGRAEIVDAGEPGALGGTYTGNPMACAAALEAFRVVEKEKLAERAAHLGRKLEDRLRRSAERFPLIGDVRGLGAMQAIELVLDRSTREPAKEKTTQIVQHARERGLLLLPTGTFGNVIRFLMPLTIDDGALDEGFAVLEQSIQLVS
jgi:4-aminobutyrate aminotransferase / (S)-3-amino-2-methylpropionate transaminase / 5-aminovalerate transaminase